MLQTSSTLLAKSSRNARRRFWCLLGAIVKCDVMQAVAIHKEPLVYTSVGAVQMAVAAVNDLSSVRSSLPAASSPSVRQLDPIARYAALSGSPPLRQSPASLPQRQQHLRSTLMVRFGKHIKVVVPTQDRMHHLRPTHNPDRHSPFVDRQRHDCSAVRQIGHNQNQAC
jgi:hypothetical protein